jgi:hypothetical protein
MNSTIILILFLILFAISFGLCFSTDKNNYIISAVFSGVAIIITGILMIAVQELYWWPMVVLFFPIFFSDIVRYYLS